MKIVTEFNEKTNPWAYSNDRDANYMYVRCVEDICNNQIKALGFVTLEEVLQRLGFDKRTIDEMINKYGNYVWSIDKKQYIDLNCNYWEQALNMDPVIEIDLTGLDTV